MEEKIKELLDDLRRETLELAERVNTAKRSEFFSRERSGVPPEADRGEMQANITLAFRHLEDGRMRLGKAIQAYDGGVSVYDRSPGVGDAPEPREGKPPVREG